MPLPQTYAKGVLFVGRKRTGKPPKITATGFLVTMEPWHSYVVTAAHVVEGSDDMFVRIRTKDGFRDEPAPCWIPHGKHDVAVAPIDLPDDHDLIATHVDQFIDADDALGGFGDIELGDAVYFIGLLGKVKAMTERNVPIVRTGFLGALMQEDVPVRRAGEETRLITAHLIDCRSFSGFSGSPAYLQKTRPRIVRMEDGRPGITPVYRTLLLGLIGGHFDDWAKAKTREVVLDDAAEDDDAGEDDAYEVTDEIKAQVSTGVGYVIPAEFIRATLMKEELRNMRANKEREEAEAAEREEAENAATEDAIPVEAESEFQRFEDLTRSLVNTPKSEVDEKRKGQT